MKLSRGDVVDIYVVPRPPSGLGIVCPICGRTAVITSLPFNLDDLPPHSCRNNPAFRAFFLVQLAQGHVEKKTYESHQDGEHRIVLKYI